ncbi:helix-turn-helix domain-containing protein [Pelosinus propionicus]
MSNNYLTAEEVGKMLQLSTKRIYDLAQRRQIPGLKIGKYWRFNEEKIFKYLESRYGNGYQ